MSEQYLVRIETNPFRKQKRKFKMRVPKMNNSGVPIVAADGSPLFTFTDATNVTRIPGTSTTLAPARTPTGELMTGLDVIVENPYKDEMVYTQEWGDRILKGKPKVKLQHLLEYKHGVPYNYYTSRISMDVKASNEEKTFFETNESRLVMRDNTTFLDLRNPNHEVLYYMLKAHLQVANSYAELEEGGNLMAEWYIVDIEEKENIQKSRIEKEIIAASALKDLTDKGAAITICKALSLDEAGKIALNSSSAQRALHEFYNQNSTCYDMFMEMYDKWKDSPTRPYVIAAAELFDWIKLGIVSNKNGKYTWIRSAGEGKASETFMHPTKNAFITSFMLDPHYQDEVEAIREIYNMKSK